MSKYHVHSGRLAFRLGLGMGLLLASSGAEAGQIANIPLYLGISPPANVILAVDDSGSMFAEILMGDGKDVYMGGGINLFPDKTALTFMEIGKNLVTNNIPPLPAFAETRSPYYNHAYFDPAAQYLPWESFDTSFGQAPANAAGWDPYPGSITFNLTEKIRNGVDGYSFNANIAGGDANVIVPSNMAYKVSDAQGWLEPGDPRRPDSSDPPVPFNVAAFTRIFLEYYPATFYLPAGTALPDDYSSFNLDKKIPVTTLNGISLEGYEIKPENFTNSGQYDKAIKNFANWFTYYRKRHLATRGAIGRAFKDTTNMRLGIFTINDAVSGNNPPTPLTYLGNFADKKALLEKVYKLDSFASKVSSSKGTPTMNAVRYMGEQFKQNGVIEAACQRNAGILFTDGNANWDILSVGDVDAAFGSPYADGVPNTLADVAMSYYTQNLAPGLDPGKVPVPFACAQPNPDPSLDCNKDPHLNFFAVNLGLKGNAYEPGHLIDPYTNQPGSAWDWPTLAQLNPSDATGTDNAYRQDDLWHATVNGRGSLLSAQSPEQIREKLTDILNTIALSSGSASSVATTSTYLSTDTLVFLASYNSAIWSGDIAAYPFLDDTVDITTFKAQGGWLASEKITESSYSARKDHIFTYHPTHQQGIPFEWDALGSSQKQALNFHLNTKGETIGDDLGEYRVDYIKGDVSREQRKGGEFRNRIDEAGNVGLLGDFVNSNPAFVGKSQDYGYAALLGSEGSSYAAYLATKNSRPEVLYIGGNDGMLHAFNGARYTGGQELFGYIPYAAYGHLYRTASPNYTVAGAYHRFLVDGSPWAGDAYLGGAWKTILLGANGAGGRGVFALDVTNPASFAAANVLWDFSQDTQPGYADLGYTLAQPIIVRTNSDAYPWVALVANGYNSDNGHAVLFVLDLQDGHIVKLIDTQAGGNGVVPKNGLSAPIAIDINQDRKADFVYAGDLVGNLWKFDLSSPSVGNWKVAYGSTGSPEPLFVACAVEEASCAPENRQPITDKPQVGLAGPDRSGFTVFFGTGKYFEEGDNNVPPNPQLQTFYGIWDQNAGNDADQVRRQQLAEQTIDGKGAAFGYSVRFSSRNPVDYESQRGWRLDLKVGGTLEGERVVSNPVLHDGRIAFTSFKPINTSDPAHPENRCTHGGVGWLMELDALTGVGPDEKSALFDLNKNGKFDDLPGGKAPSAIGFDAVPNATRVVRDDKSIYRITSQSSGSISVEQGPQGIQPTGRLSWRQIR